MPRSLWKFSSRPHSDEAGDHSDRLSWPLAIFVSASPEATTGASTTPACRPTGGAGVELLDQRLRSAPPSPASREGDVDGVARPPSCRGVPPPPPPPLSPPLESARTAATAMAATAMMMTTKRPPRMAQRYLPARAVPSGRRPSVPAMDSSELAALDRRVLWHPFTQQRGWADEEPPSSSRAREGSTWSTPTAARYIDGVSSLWCNVHGHRHPAHRRGRARRSSTASRTRRCSGSRTRRRSSSPRGWSRSPRRASRRVFYSDNGSTAVEVALKMAFQYWQHRGERAAHGVRLPARRVPRGHDRLGVGRRHRPLPLALPPAAVRRPPGRARRRRGARSDCSRARRARSRRSSSSRSSRARPACSLQPARLPARRSRELCDEHDVLLICDEVATGFGRTGHDVRLRAGGRGAGPACASAKGLTGGYLPLAATLTTERVYEPSSATFEEFKTFFHGHTYTGNPLACAAALATLDVFEQERTLERLQPKIAAARTSCSSATSRRCRRWPRSAARGFMVGIELDGVPARRRASATRSRWPRAAAARSSARSATWSC